LRAITVRYVRMAEDTMARYYADAMLNGLRFDRDAEEQAIVTFAHSLHRAGQDFIENPLGLPSMPNWDRVAAAIPDFSKLLLGAAEADATEVKVQAA
jgi:glucosyl-3-phosphoglycerate synthase